MILNSVFFILPVDEVHFKIRFWRYLLYTYCILIVILKIGGSSRKNFECLKIRTTLCEQINTIVTRHE